ncbi:MAG: TonB-dependent receptor [Deltaproteobacteria bacterium]|nr:TonB-dependent receptor [Deltaproteobacteria bacterium]
MKRFILCMAVFFCSSLLILSSVNRALAQNGNEGIPELEEMVVTAGRVEEKKKEITSNVTIIDEEEIKISSATSLGDLLAEKGIGHIHKYTGTLTSIGIRGFRTETHGNDLMGHVLILLNGRRAGTGNASKIMTKNIEKIEIIRGPASVQYGSAAMGGVINVITRQGKDKPTAFVEGVLGSWGHEEWSTGGSGKYNKLDFSGSYTNQSMDEYDTANGDKYRNTGYDRQESYSLNSGYEFLPGNRIGVIYHNFNADNIGCSDKLSGNDLDDYKDTSNESIDIIYDGRTPGAPFSWKLRYFDGEDGNEWFFPAQSDPSGWDQWYPFWESKTDYKGAQAQISYNQKYLLITAGFDWANYEESSSADPKRTEYENPAGFILAKTRLFNEMFIITGGLRYDEYEVEIKDPKGNKKDDHNFSPKIGVAYLFTDYLKLRANYGEAFKMPSAKEMAWDAVTFGSHYLGNPDLDPEESKTYEAGVDLFYGSLNSSLTYFYTDFDDKIVQVDKPGNIKTWENIGGAKIQGIEGQFSYDIGDLFTWDYQVKPYVSFVYLTEYEDDETGDDLKYVDKYNVSWGITISDLKGLSANLNFAHTGKQDITDYESGTYETITKDGFTVANLTISKKILNTIKYGSVALKGEIQNLFDKDYEYCQGYPMPGRSFFIGMRYDY